MKKLLLPCLALSLSFFISCGNAGGDSLKAKVDSLYDQVLKGHDAGMARMGKLTDLRSRTQRAIDSIDRLPAQAKEGLSAFRAQLENAAGELSRAEISMNQWMKEINFDTLQSDIKDRIDYLTSENEKVTRVKEAITGSIQKADSLLKSRF